MNQSCARINTISKAIMVSVLFFHYLILVSHEARNRSIHQTLNPAFNRTGTPFYRSSAVVDGSSGMCEPSNVSGIVLHGEHRQYKIVLQYIGLCGAEALASSFASKHQRRTLEVRTLQSASRFTRSFCARSRTTI